MTLFECFEIRKNALLTRLTENKRPSAALVCIQDTFDTVLYQYINECRDDRLRSEAAFMVNTAKTTFPLMECVSETKIWVSKNGTDSEKKSISFGFTVFIILALLTFAAMAAFEYKAFAAVDSDAILTCVGLIAVASLMMFFAGVYLAKKPKHKDNNDYKADIYINPDDVVRRITAVILQIDKNLEAIETEENEEPLVGDKGVFDTQQLDFYSSLLEGAYSENGEYALEQLEQTAHYLHSLGISLTDYSEENKDNFELLPSSEETKTIVPAMIYSGRLLKKGLATEKEVKLS